MTAGNAPFFVDNEVIVLTRNGIWIADGTEITHEPTRKLFGRSLKRDAEGYYLHVGRETKRITVEDTALFVSMLEGDPASPMKLRVSDGVERPLDPGTLSYKPGRLTCRVDSPTLGPGTEAKFLHAAYFELLRHLEEDSRSYFLTLGGKRVELAQK